MLLEPQQALEVVRRRKNVYVRQRRAHAPSDGLVVGQAEQRVQPDELANSALDRCKLRRKLFRFSCVQTIAQNQEESVARAQFFGMNAVELSQRRTDPRSSGPACAKLRQRVQHVGQVAPTKQIRDLDQIRAEQERIHLLEIF